MGIPLFYRDWISKKYSDAIISGLPSKVSSLSIDLNGMIHKAVQETYALSDDAGYKKKQRISEALARGEDQKLMKQCFDLLIKNIIDLVAAVKPEDSLILAVDGIAPGAKIQQQRQRRYKGSKGIDKNVFNRNAVTPGTEFMFQLDDALTDYFLSSKREYLPPNIIYSSHLQVGEGEHKIMNYYRDGLMKSHTGSHILYGLDADLIVLSLLCPQTGIFLCREDLDQSLDIDSLRSAVEKNCMISDFGVLMCLMGNDFLPKQVGFYDFAKSLDYMISQLKGTALTEIKDGEVIINYNNLILFFKKLKRNEIDCISNMDKQNFRYPNPMQKVNIKLNKFDLKGFMRDYTNHVLGPHNGYHYGVPANTQLLTKVLAISKAYEPQASDIISFGKFSKMEINNFYDREDINEWMKQYIIGISWVLAYYTKGHKGINMDWSFNYYYAPLLTMYETFNFDNNIKAHLPNKGEVDFDALCQIVTVLPHSSIDLVPVELIPLYQNDSPIADMMPKDFIEEIMGTSSPHHGVAVLPFVERGRVSEAVNSLNISKNRRNKWALIEEHKVFNADKNQTNFYVENVLQNEDFETSFSPKKSNDVPKQYIDKIVKVIGCLYTTPNPKKDIKKFSDFENNIKNLINNYHDDHEDKIVELRTFLSRFSSIPYQCEERVDHRIKEVQKLIGKNRDSVILDVGAGDGKITEALAKRYQASDFYAIDDKFKSTDRVTKLKYTREGKIPFPDNSVDIILILMVLHHVEEKEKLLFEMHRVLRPNGIIIVREHNAPIKDGRIDRDFVDFIDIYHDIYTTSKGEVQDDHTSVFTFDKLLRDMKEFNFVFGSKIEDEGAAIKSYYASFYKRLAVNDKVNYLNQKDVKQREYEERQALREQKQREYEERQALREKKQLEYEERKAFREKKQREYEERQALREKKGKPFTPRNSKPFTPKDKNFKSFDKKNIKPANIDDEVANIDDLLSSFGGGSFNEKSEVKNTRNSNPIKKNVVIEKNKPVKGGLKTINNFGTVKKNLDEENLYLDVDDDLFSGLLGEDETVTSGTPAKIVSRESTKNVSRESTKNTRKTVNAFKGEKSFKPSKYEVSEDDLM